MLTAEDWVDFADALRKAGFKVSTQQLITSQDLLLKLATRGGLPEHPQVLQRWLGPIFCTNQQEQDVFPGLFAQWLSHRVELKPVSLESKIENANTTPTKPKFWKNFKRWWPILLATLLMVGGGILLYRAWTYTLSGEINTAPSPVNEVDVQLDEQKIPISKEGAFTFKLKRSELPKTLRIEHPAFETYSLKINKLPYVISEIHLQKRVGGKDFPLVRRGRNLSDKRANIVKPASADKPISIINRIPAKKPQSQFINITVKKNLFDKPCTLALVLTPFALCLLSFLVFWLFRRGVLRKLSSIKQPDLRSLKIAGITDWALDKQAFRRLLYILHRHHTQTTDRLDPTATVQSTIQHGGLFTPMYGTRKAVPEYLALVDRLGPLDEQAQMADSLLDKLAAGKLFIDRYQFHADPRFCREPDKLSAPVSLKELGARCGSHTLLVFSDGGGFINPYTGAIKPGVEQLRSWSERVLFSPESGTDSYTQAALEPLDFNMTLPLGQAGLVALALGLQHGDMPLKKKIKEQDYPALLEQSTSRWLEHLVPRENVLQSLLKQIEAYLGAAGFQWLCACAIYPVLHWNVTLFLGGQLGIAHKTLTELLPKLVRLPWFRHGSMPDWLRVQLIQNLSDTIQNQVRDALLKLLTTEPKPNQAVTTLDIVNDKLPSFWQSLQNHIKLKAKIDAAPFDSPLRDYVFLSFMAERRIDPLILQVPKRIQRKLQLRDYRTAALLWTLALATSVGLLYSKLKPTQNEQLRVEIPAMIDISGGSFQMGCVENNKDCGNNEKPVREVKIAPFQMGAYEVTVGQFKLFVDATGYETKAEQSGSCYSYNKKSTYYGDIKGNYWREPGYKQTNDDNPVTCVSWDDAQVYLKWLSQITHQKWRLPTEAEWEYAVRAGTITNYSWGDELPVCGNQRVNGAQFFNCRGKEAVNVGSYSANLFGLFDMHGNVWEWTEDCWHANYVYASADGGVGSDCVNGLWRVLRGGSWNVRAKRLRSAFRNHEWPIYRSSDVGFRAVKTNQ